MSDIVFLNGEKLLKLAQLIRGYEVENLKSLYFNSVGEEVKYLRICNSNHETVERLLNESGELANSKYKNDSIRGPISALLHSYVETCLNNARQIFTNYTLRRTYLDKITTHVDGLIKEFNELDPSNPTEVAALTDKIENYKDVVVNYTKARVNTHASQEFSRNLKNSGIDRVPVTTAKVSLGYGGKFEDLEDEQKMLVYDAIVEASGRGKVLNDKVLRAIASPGSNRDSKDISIKDVGAKAMLLYNAASITWDVYTADHPIKEATRDAIKKVTKEGGAILKKIVMAAVETGLLEGVEVSSFFVPAVGAVVGFLASYILGEIAGTIFDAIFGSGGTATLPNEGFIFHVADMPDGKALAKKIANN